MIRILYKKPYENFCEMYINDELEEYQSLVEGYIETVSLTQNLVIVCNEEGRLKGMDPNCEINGIDFVGPIFLIGANDEGDFIDCPFGIDDIYFG